MKTIHLISYGYTGKGHGKEYVRNFCRQLGGEFAIKLYACSETPVEEPPNCETIYVPLTWANLDKPIYKRYGVISLLFRQRRRMQYTANYIRGVFAKGKIQEGDIVFVMDYTAVSLKTFFSQKQTKKLKTYLWIHSARFGSSNLLYAAYKAYVKSNFKRFVRKRLKGIIVNGDYIKNSLSQQLNYPLEKIHAVQYPSEIDAKPWGKAEARAQLNIDPEERVVLFFGGLRKDKNIEEVVRSTSKCKAKPLLLIAGSSKDVTEKDLKNWIDNYNHTNVRLNIKYLSEEEMSLYYSASDVLLLTYGEESASQSGPLSLAREFLLPAIVTDTGELGYYVKSNKVGFAANPSEKDSFVHALNDFFELGDIDEYFKSDIQTCKDKFSWSTAAMRYKKIFLEGN